MLTFDNFLFLWWYLSGLEPLFTSLGDPVLLILFTSKVWHGERRGPNILRWVSLNCVWVPKIPPFYLNLHLQTRGMVIPLEVPFGWVQSDVSLGTLSILPTWWTPLDPCFSPPRLVNHDLRTSRLVVPTSTVWLLWPVVISRRPSY